MSIFNQQTTFITASYKKTRIYQYHGAQNQVKIISENKIILVFLLPMSQNIIRKQNEAGEDLYEAYDVAHHSPPPNKLEL